MLTHDKRTSFTVRNLLPRRIPVTPQPRPFSVRPLKTNFAHATNSGTALDLPTIDLEALAAELPDTPLDWDSTDPEPPPAERRILPADAIAIGRRLRHVTRPRTRRCVDFRAREAAALDHLGALPAAGESLHLLMPGDYSGTDLTIALIRQLRPPADVTLCSLSSNEESGLRLAELLDRRTIGRLRILLSDYFARASAPEFATLRHHLEPRGATVRSARVHAKVYLLRPDDGPERIVCEGSQNLRSCNSVEQATVTNDPDLFAFHQAWLETLFA